MPGAELGHDSDEEEGLEEEDDENAEFFDAIAEHPEGFTLSVSKSRESLQSSSSELSVDMENAKPMLSRTLSDNSGSSKQEAARDVTGAETSDEVVSATDRDEFTDCETNGGSKGGIVRAPITVQGSFGLVTVCIHVLIDLIIFKLLMLLGTLRVVHKHSFNFNFLHTSYQTSVHVCS